MEEYDEYPANCGDDNFLERAMVFHSRRGGPVWLDIPLDVQGAYVETEELKHFSEVCLGQVEEELKRTISLLKTYEVKVIGHVVIRATQPKYAKEAIQLHPFVFNDLVWIDPTDEIKER